MKTWSLTFAVLATALFANCKHDQEPSDTHDHGAALSSKLPAGVNPVQNEMRVLHEATRDWVTAIANNDLAAIAGGIKKVHGARTLTETALKTGSYRPPKNPGDLQQFEKQDEAFHERLVRLMRAAQAKDLPRATLELGRVLEGCTDCHSKYRF
ncbi:MAG: cytochrome c [Myxococcales bacterium]|nr:cytochrome c [Myxococcales bacterium]MCB9576636.1 cytochrome c [Polyangiaceae bacterium]